MDRWRLIIDPPLEGAFNMGCDYAIMKSVSRGDSSSTLRFYRWKKPTVTIGYFQILEDEVDVGECARSGVDTIRRVTGGGAVYHDLEITYSLAAPLSGGLVHGTVLDSYRRICEPIVQALRSFGIEAAYAPVNDILAGSKKISGSAQTRREGVLLQHGTILMGLRRERMFRCLRISPEKLAGRGVTAPAEGVGSLEDLLGKRALTEGFHGELIDALSRSFAEAFDIEFTDAGITPREREEALAIERDVFLNPRWNRERDFKPGRL